MRTLKILPFCLSGVLSSNTVAAATPATPEGESIPGKRWIERPLSVETTVGLFRPIGELGVGVDWAFLPHTSLNLGAGVAYGGPQASAMFRVRYPWEGDALGIEGGWSGGPFEEFTIFGCESGGPRNGCVRWPFAHWINGAITYEHRAESGFSFRMFLGAGSILNNLCIPDGSGIMCFDKSVGYGGVALGYAFDFGKLLHRPPPRDWL